MNNKSLPYDFIYPLMFYNNVYNDYVYYYKNYLYKPNLLIKLMKLYYPNRIKEILKSIVLKLFMKIMSNNLRNKINITQLRNYHYYNYLLSLYCNNKELKDYNLFLKILKNFIID